MKSQKGESSLLTIVAIMLAAVLMFIFPMISIAERNDEATQMYVKTSLDGFVNQIAAKGTITQEDIDRIESNLAATKNSYDIEITIDISDYNEKLKQTLTYSVFDPQIREQLKNSGIIVLKENDRITVKAKTTNTTISQMIKNVLYGMTGKDVALVTQASAVCTVTGTK